MDSERAVDITGGVANSKHLARGTVDAVGELAIEMETRGGAEMGAGHRRKKRFVVTVGPAAEPISRFTRTSRHQTDTSGGWF